MNLPELDISIWRIPHHPRGDDWGHIIHICEALDDDLPGGSFQSLRGLKTGRLPEFDPNYPFQGFSVSPEAFAALVLELDNVSYSFKQHPFTPMLGGLYFGLRVSRGYRECVVAWHGLFEDQDAQIQSVYKSVERLAASINPPTA
jgi:hypothetical protein